jgi:Glycosyl hydrolases family 18
MRWPSRVLILAGTALALLALVLPGPTAASAQAGGRRVLGYYVPYDRTSWDTLQAQAPLIDDVAVQWVTVDACGQIGSRDDRTLGQFARERGMRIFPSLLTMSEGLNHRLLTDEPTTATAVSQIVEYVTNEGYEGFDVDFEGVRPEDGPAFSAFVARLGAVLHERDKVLALALPAKAGPTTSPWFGAYDYAALGQHADLITIMTYDYSGAWGRPGPVAPYDWVDRVTAFSTDQIPAEKVLVGLAFYGYDWNTTSGGARSLSYTQAAALADRYGAPIALDPATQSGKFSYQARAGDPPPPRSPSAALDHEIAVREPARCPVQTPEPTPTPTPRPIPPPDAMQEHEVWLEESGSAEARLGLANRHGTGGVATWRLGLEDPRVWEVFRQWRTGER